MEDPNPYRILSAKKRSYAAAFEEQVVKTAGKRGCRLFGVEKRCDAVAFKEEAVKTTRKRGFRLFGVHLSPLEENNSIVVPLPDIKPIDILIPPEPTIKQECPDFEEKNPTIVLLDYIKSRLGGDREISEVELLLEKKLTKTDLDSDQSRLSIPGGMIRNYEFLTDSEMKYLEGKNDKGKKNWLPVKVFGSSLLPGVELRLTRWGYAKGKNGTQQGWKYVLKKRWNDFWRQNNLEEGQKIQLLSFRYNHRICFAIVGLEKDNHTLIQFFH